MQASWTTIARSVLVAAFGVGVAYGADQTILGQTFLVKDTKGSKVVATGKEIRSTATLVGDPTANGATVTITADGGTPSTQTFTLPASNWKGDATRGFKYRDATGAAGAIRAAAMKLTKNGRFLAAVVASGKTGTLSIVPPDPGTDACVLIQLGGGDSYSIRFGPDSKITNKDGRLFKAKRPLTAGTCVTTTTTTSSSTTSTTLYGSPSRAFLRRVTSLME
jgi:hypothetical protein